MIRYGKSVTYTFATYIMGLAIIQLKITGTHMYYITDEVFVRKKSTEQCIRLLIT